MVITEATKGAIVYSRPACDVMGTYMEISPDEPVASDMIDIVPRR